MKLPAAPISPMLFNLLPASTSVLCFVERAEWDTDFDLRALSLLKMPLAPLTDLWKSDTGTAESTDALMLSVNEAADEAEPVESAYHHVNMFSTFFGTL
ncbi:hypothetical protein D918_05703 [Trichuris suis]|nr:hypothetical protein D918_05703 [Trichuris suis]